MTVQSWRDFEVFTCGLFDGLMPSAIIAHDLRVKDEHGISHQIDVDIRIPHENKLITIMLDTKL